MAGKQSIVLDKLTLGGKTAVAGPVSATDGNLAVFDGVTGALLKDGGPPGGGGVFSGALLHLTGDFTTGTTGSISWDAAEYDTDSFFDHAGNPTRLTVPSGVTHVRLSGGVDFGSLTGAIIIGINKNGSSSFAGRTVIGASAPGILAFASPVLAVAPGDYFELVFANAGSGHATNDSSTYFGIEVVA